MDKVHKAYKFLGIPPEASIFEITKVYRALAKKFHPDSNPHDSANSHMMMMKINEAYTTIKNYLESGRSKRRAKAYDLNENAWVRRERPFRGKTDHSPEEFTRRERERLNQYWEALVKERQREMKDKKSYRVILKYTYTLISFYYRQRLHNPGLRSRPYSIGVFEEFIGKLNLLVEKSAGIARAGSSKLYRRRSHRLYEFLKFFLEDTVRDFNLHSEKRASALSGFENAVRTADKFIDFYFSHPEVKRDEAFDMLRDTLDHFESFLRAYPESPLVQYGERKVEVLEKLYRAFMKEE